MYYSEEFYQIIHKKTKAEALEEELKARDNGGKRMLNRIMKQRDNEIKNFNNIEALLETSVRHVIKEFTEAGGNINTTTDINDHEGCMTILDLASKLNEEDLVSKLKLLGAKPYSIIKKRREELEIEIKKKEQELKILNHEYLKMV